MNSGLVTLAALMMTLVVSAGESAEDEEGMGMMDGAGGSGGWYVVNDGVMGGISQSGVLITDRKTMRFYGKVSLENNGGFASTRHDADAFGIGRGDGISMRVKGDGKTYQLRVRTSDQFDGIAYKADFTTVKDQWQDLRIPWSRFEATYHGRILSDAPALEGNQIRQVGFLIADKQEGSFELEVESLGWF